MVLANKIQRRTSAAAYLASGTGGAPVQFHRHVATTRWLLLLSFFVFTLAVAANSAAKTFRKEVEEKVSLSGETKLQVANSRGKTIIVGKEGLEEILIKATKIVKSRNQETADKLMEALTFEVKAEGDEIRIITHHPESNEEEKSIWSFFRGVTHRTAIDFAIEVPHEFDINVASTSGDVQISSIKGDAELQGTSGDARIREIGGLASIDLTSGDVEVLNVGRDVRIGLSSGSVFVDGVGGHLQLAATSGDVEVYHIVGNADLKLVSGDLVLGSCGGDLTSVSSSGDMLIKDVNGSASVSSSSGNIEIYLSLDDEEKFTLTTCSGDVDVIYNTPQDIGFLLDVNTMSGSIDGDLEIKLEKVSRRHLKGIVGKGKAAIAIATASGDVSIYQSKNNK